MITNLLILFIKWLCLTITAGVGYSITVKMTRNRFQPRISAGLFWLWGMAVATFITLQWMLP